MSKRHRKFQDREYRASYAESFLDTTIATQIRVLREQRGWTQEQLAEHAEMKQSRISALENAGYSGWSTKTLKRIARAYDVPLFIVFGSYGQLLKDIRSFSRQALERPSFVDDPDVIVEPVTSEAPVQASSTSNVVPFRKIRNVASSSSPRSITADCDTTAADAPVNTSNTGDVTVAYGR